jgi:peptidoglycan/xylan/chitin deacetylase (PgdA/CDA1 family)
VIRSVRLISTLICGVLVTAGTTLCASGSPAQSAVAPTALHTAAAPELVPVAALVAEDRVALHAGRLLAVRSRRVLDPIAFPPVITVGGARVTLADEVPVRSLLQVKQGLDRVEAIVTRRIHIAADTRGGLLKPGRPGILELRVGQVSGEIVSRRVLSAPRQGPLKVPGTVLLTFDDGPDPMWTPRVLALLRQRHVHAIFCLIGRDARRYPDLVRQIVHDGHQLCDHTEGHDEHLSTDPLATARAQIARGAQAITLATGQRPLWFRAPGGAWSPLVERLVAEGGMTPLKWTVDPRDWERPTPRAIVDRVMATARPGSVILLHDGGGTRRNTVRALAALLLMLPHEGLHFAEPAPPPNAP